MMVPAGRGIDSNAHQFRPPRWTHRFRWFPALPTAISIAMLVQTTVVFGLAQSPLLDLLDGVERNLEGIRDLSADFVQIHEDPLNRTMEETGHLYLKRPRMMRWEYTETLWVTDGEIINFYEPSYEQVTRESVGDSFDERVPIMFLLGRSDLQNEFSRFELLNTTPKVSGTRTLRMYPKRDSDIVEVLLEVEPMTFDIRRLRLTYIDGSASEFLFEDIRTNIGVDESLFEFVPPAGVEIIEGVGP